MKQDTTDTSITRVIHAAPNAADRDLVHAALLSDGFELKQVSSSEALLELLGATTFDVVLSDSGLPDVEGRSLLDVIGDRHPGLPVIVVTNPDLEEPDAGKWERGAADCVLGTASGVRHLPAAIVSAIAIRKLSLGNQQLAQEALARANERQNSLLLGRARRDRGAALRKRAVELLGHAPSGLRRQDADAIQQLVYELEVFQTELELQNDELRRTELNLMEARDRYQELFDSAPVGYLTIDSNGTILEANATVSRMLNARPGGLLDAKLSDFIHRDDQDEWYLHMRSLVSPSRADQHRNPTENAICELRVADGNDAWQPVQVGSTPTTDGSEAGSFRTVLTDIRERKRNEEALRETLEKLRQAQDQMVRQERLRAVGELASGAAHDLNNALSPVLGYASLLLQDSSLSSISREWVELIRTAAVDAAEVVVCLGEFCRAEEAELHRERLDLVELMDRLPLLTRPKWHDEAQQSGRKVTIESDLQRVPAIAGVEAEIRQALTNLVVNAVDALPGGGQITLRSYTNDGAACLEISDNGVGMSAEEQRQCFEPFYSRKTGGSGLGLSVCYGIVKRHQGEIEVESQPSKGTLFRLTFPALAATAAADKTADLDADFSLPRRNVLYIDDDDRVRPTVAALLHHLGQTVTLAESGESGLALIESGDYDLVITDLGMAGLDGRQIVRTVRQRHRDLPVVMLTGWSEEAALGEVEEDSMPSAFLQKPAAISSLKAVLARVLAPPSEPLD